MISTISRNNGPYSFSIDFTFHMIDYCSTRGIRQLEDKAAAIRDVFEMMSSNLKYHYRSHKGIPVVEGKEHTLANICPPSLPTMV